MSLTSAENSKEFDLVPAGLYVARCYRLIDGGTQDVEWAGIAKKQRKIRITWEILDDEVRMNDGRPFSLSKIYTNTLSEKGNLRKDLEAWRGRPFTNEELKGFDLTDIVGKYCQLQVIHEESQKNGKVYDNIGAIVQARAPYPDAVNDAVTWNYDKYTPADWNALSNYEKEFVKKADEWYPQIEEESEAEANKLTPSPGAADADIEIEDIPDFPADDPRSSGYAKAKAQAAKLKAAK